MTSFISLSFCLLSDSGGIQTHNLLIRSQMLYSVELRNLRSLFAGAKVRSFSVTTKFFGNFFCFSMVFYGFYCKILINVDCESEVFVVPLQAQTEIGRI